MLRPLTSEPARPSEPERDLKSEDFSAKAEDKVRAALKPLNNEVRSVRAEAEASELVSALKMEFFSTRPALRVNEPANALKIEFFSARLEAMVIETVGIRLQLVATPACNVQETGVVLEA